MCQIDTNLEITLKLKINLGKMNTKVRKFIKVPQGAWSRHAEFEAHCQGGGSRKPEDRTGHGCRGRAPQEHEGGLAWLPQGEAHLGAEECHKKAKPNMEGPGGRTPRRCRRAASRGNGGRK